MAGLIPVRDEGLIVMADDTGQPHYLTATDLSRLLADHKPLRLVLLNACEGARGSSQDIFSSTASILVRRGIPAVLAMQYPVTDRAAVEFARSFYESLADGLPADAAVAEARKAISIAVADTAEWGTPVLFMRASDGILFGLAAAMPARPTPSRPSETMMAAVLPQLQTELIAPPGPDAQPAPTTLSQTDAVEMAVSDPLLSLNLNVNRGRSGSGPQPEGQRFAGGDRDGAVAYFKGWGGGNLGIGSSSISPVDGMVQVYVPAGEFLMGSADSDSHAFENEKPQHKVYLEAFWIDRTEVTNAMFARFVEATGYKTDAEKAGGGKVLLEAESIDMVGADWQHPRGRGSDLAGLDQHPVVQVSWNDALAYCAWAKRRLPTEAEWEKAARGTDGRRYPWGDAWDVATTKRLDFADRNLAGDWTDKFANDGYQFTAPVGVYRAGASPYEALDMAGNVWEWVADVYDEKYYARSPEKIPRGRIRGSTASCGVARGAMYVSRPFGRCARSAGRTDSWVSEAGGL